MGRLFSKDKEIINTEPQPLPELRPGSEAKVELDEGRALAAPAKTINLQRRLAPTPLAPVLIAAALLILCGLLKLGSWMRTVAYLIPFLAASFDHLMIAIEKLCRKDYFAAEPWTVAAGIIIFALGHYGLAVLLMILFGVTALLRDFAVKNCARELDDLGALIPKSAAVETAEGLLQVEPDYVKPGEIIAVDAGERIALDGVIVEGMTSVDTAAVSGQSKPWDLTVGYKVYSGCLNVSAPVRVRVTKDFEHSTASRLVKLSEKATEFKSTQEELCRRYTKLFSLVMLLAALAFALIVPLAQMSWRDNLAKAAVLLMLSCPTALPLSVSLAYKKCLGKTAAHGIFAKGADCIESMSQSETVVFDKTGTITEGRYIISDVDPVGISEQELINIAACAELFSRHPIAAALRDSADKTRLKNAKVVQVEETPGRGISAFVDDRHVYVGNTALLEEHGIVCAVPKRSGAAIHVAVDERYRGHILVSDRIRSGAFDALEGLRVQGAKKLVLLTGDVLSVARPLASRLNFDMLRAELSAEGKRSAVSYLMSNKGSRSALAFIGDGYNDAELMKTVDVGIAMGALGSEAAFDAADVLVMDRDIRKLPKLFESSKKTALVAKENIIATAALSLGIAALSLAGILPLSAAVVGSFIVSALTLINTIRIK